MNNIMMGNVLDNLKREIKIIVVDDKPADLLLLEGLLCGYGYQVYTFSNGRAALDALEKISPDLILLNVSMPGMDGYEVCTELKADINWRDIPVIFISSMSKTVDKVKGFNVGGVDYISKPFQIAEVNARVKTHLTLRIQQQELQESYLKLRDIEEMHESLVNMVVHDMRSPLFGILGMLGLIKDALNKKPEDCPGYLESTFASTHELIEMVNALHDINRLEEGKMPINFSLCDIQYLINQATKFLSIEHSDIELAIEMLTDKSEIHCDGGLIRRVLQNLLSNAVKFSYMGGKIIVRVERPENYLRVSVIDNGPGIHPEYHDKIFEKFAQVSSRTNDRKHSTGLGLTFCKLVIQCHHGDIGVCSVPDKGSSFWFIISDNPAEN